MCSTGIAPYGRGRGAVAGTTNLVETLLVACLYQGANHATKIVLGIVEAVDTVSVNHGSGEAAHSLGDKRNYGMCCVVRGL